MERKLKSTLTGQILPESIIKEQALDLMACQYANEKYAGTDKVYAVYFAFVEGYKQALKNIIP